MDQLPELWYGYLTNSSGYDTGHVTPSYETWLQ